MQRRKFHSNGRFLFFFGGDWIEKRRRKKERETRISFDWLIDQLVEANNFVFRAKSNLFESRWIDLKFFFGERSILRISICCAITNYSFFFFFIYYYFTLSFRVAFYNRFCEQNRYTSLGSTWWMLKRMGDVHSVNCPIYIYIKRNTNTSRDSCCCCCCRCYYYYCCL